MKNTYLVNTVVVYLFDLDHKPLTVQQLNWLHSTVILNILWNSVDLVPCYIYIFVHKNKYVASGNCHTEEQYKVVLDINCKCTFTNVWYKHSVLHQHLAIWDEWLKPKSSDNHTPGQTTVIVSIPGMCHSSTAAICYTVIPSKGSLFNSACISFYPITPVHTKLLLLKSVTHS